AERITLVGTVERDDDRRGAVLIADQVVAHVGLLAGRSMGLGSSGNSIGICSRAKASVLPWVSIRNEREAPPARTSYSTKLKASRLGASKRSTLLGWSGLK